MKGIQLKIKGEWVALPEDFSLTLSQTNPLFNEDGAFSFPFEVPIEPNRSIFKNISNPFGAIFLKDIDGIEAELWFDGVLLYKGIIETDEEIEFEDTIPMTFLSGNSDFMTRIQDLNARDIPLDRDIKLGYLVDKGHVVPFDGKTAKTYRLPSEIMKYQNVNISAQYPISTYCNVRVCTSKVNDSGDIIGYQKLEADRPWSGVCFYVLYFIDLLMKKLNIAYSKDNLLSVEDMSRLAFFVTTCDYTTGETETEMSINQVRTDFPDFSLSYVDEFNWSYPTELLRCFRKDVYATNQNFPKAKVTEIISGLKDAFGIRFIYDDKQNKMNAIYLKDIFKSTDCLELNIKILSVSISRSKSSGYKISYGDSDDTAFNYSDFSNMEEFSDYGKLIKKNFSKYDNVCYLDSVTGNSYRIKVDKETEDKPVLFEVGGFNSFTQKGEGSDSVSITLPFLPVVLNDVNYENQKKTSTNPDEQFKLQQQVLAVYVDEELKDTGEKNSKFSAEVFSGEAFGYPKMTVSVTLQELYDTKEKDQSPLRTYDSGFTLGIMRGPGSDSKIEYINPNYDGEGNSEYAQVAANYAFTSDSCDNYGRFFDYNGSEAGGADQTGRFSLKLIAGKDGFPIDSQYANRGLVSKFLSEYLYFLENRKTVMLEVEMTITQLINIDFLKRYKIGDFVGFINKVSYTMAANGMEDVTIEMYTL